MKIEYIDDLTNNGQYPWADPKRLIRLYDFEHEEAGMLLLLIQQRLVRNQFELDLKEVEFIRRINCSLKFDIADTDLGIYQDPSNNFQCRLTLPTYETMVEIIRGFTDKSNKLNGYNWLYDPSDDELVDLLFSPGGTW